VQQVIASEIVSGSITTGKIAAGAVTATEIATGAITAGHIATGTITAAEIATGTITAGKILAGTITGNEIQGATITGGNLVGGTITGNHIQGSSIDAGKLNVLQLSAITADVGTVTAGVVRSGDGRAKLDLTNARLVFNNGTVAHVIGNGFGASSDLIEWVGTGLGAVGSENFAYPTATNSKFSIKTDGTVRYAGVLAVGQATNFIRDYHQLDQHGRAGAFHVQRRTNNYHHSLRLQWVHFLRRDPGWQDCLERPSKASPGYSVDDS
jgi:hypothetical protein